jgi:predicted nuclease with TOPRIM domain
MIDRKVYIEKMKAKMDEWDADLEKLQATTQSAQADMKVQYEEQMARLRQQQDEAREMLSKMTEASEAAWEDMRKGMEAAWTATNQAFIDAFSRFK